MDPIAAIFAAFLNDIAQPRTERMSERIGTEIQAELVEYQQQTIGYQYQMWRIKEPSVCNNHAHDLLSYSRCTVAAKQFFTETCQYFQQNPHKHWRHTRLKNMYCAASVSYQPTVATVSTPPEPDELAQKRQRCNQLVLATLNSADKRTIQERDTVCTEYRALRDQ